ncbi:MAG TPA: TonB-dependent receptor [Kofleriaceae bacterium]|nr:TonB-dependent receptor [Kofleriaceae bacterium]
MRNRSTRSAFAFHVLAAAFSLAALLGHAPRALAQQSTVITGKVLSRSGQPLVGATVSVAPTGDGAFTDEQGRFEIETSPGEYSLQASFSGYAPQVRKVDIGDAPVQIVFTLVDDPRYEEKVMIKGARAAVSVGARTPRSITKTPVAIDVITSEQIQEAGAIETNQVLRTVAPSYNASHQMISDGTDHINPASLRGLGPDQTLVLINGKRWHSSALVNVNGTFGRGTVGVDLNAIPTTGIEWIEILRDGASAQYGSDAIAGVVNIELKESPGVVEANALSGITAEGDGFQLLTGLNYGIPVGKRGVVNLTGEFIQRNRTDRSGPYTGIFYPDEDGDLDPADDDARLAADGLTREDLSIDLGQSQASVGMLFYNARIPFGGNELYSMGGVTYRDSQAAGFYRRLDQPGRVEPSIHELGFLPEIHPTTFDWSVGAGLRTDRESEGFRWDVSANHGGNWFDYRVENSNNASLGEDSPTEFDAGGFLFNQSSLNADVVVPLRAEALKRLALNGGAEYRLENYSIRAGEEASWSFGGEFINDDPTMPKEAGAQVFPGFQPDNEVDEFRNSVAGYLGLESEFNDRFMVDVAGRFENYQDFGSTINGKIAGRLSLVDEVALRAAASTGFRAPSLHQTYFNSTSTQFVSTGTGVLEPIQVVTAKNDDAIAAEFAVPPLEQETSVNASAGFTIAPVENFSITTDGYFIDIDNRIVLTSQFNETSVPGTADILDELAGNVSAAQFFSNAVDTSTWGADVVVDFWSEVGPGRLGLTGAGNLTRTRVVEVNVPQSVADRFGEGSQDAVRDAYFNREEENRLEDALPREKGLVQGRYSQGPISGLLRANYWGEVTYRHPTMPEADEKFGAKVTVDSELSYQLPAGMKIAVGANNLFNTFPDEQQHPANIADGQFIYSRRVTQFGVNGGFYYLRLQYFY